MVISLNPMKKLLILDNTSNFIDEEINSEESEDLDLSRADLGLKFNASANLQLI
jgi:hypothetical protein